MGIYKPQSQFMSPNNQTINNGAVNKFITKVSGEYCSGYIWQMPTLGTKTIANVVLNQLVKLSTPLYNEDNLVLNLPINSFNATTLSNFLNYPLFWNVTMVGKPKDITANTNVTTGSIIETVFTITNGNFKTGDYVYLEQDTTPSGNYYYIGVQSDLKCKLYDTREKAMAMLSTTEYKAVSFTNGALVGKDIYACAKSDDIAFKIINVGSLKLTSATISKFYNTFVPVYTQENDISINNYQAFLYNEDDEVLEQTDVIYSSDMKFFTNGLFSGNKYYVRFMATNMVGYSYDTGKVLYTVSYKQPDINAPLHAWNNCDDTTIDLEWGYLISIHGELSCGDFVENFLWDNNMGLELCPEATLTYELDDTPIIMNEKKNGDVENSTPTFVWQPKTTTWKGNIMRVINRKTGDYATIGYDGSCITLNINGVTARTQFLTIGTDSKTGKCYPYLIGFRGSKTAVHKFMAYDIPLKTTIKYYTAIRTTEDSATMAVNVESFVGIVRFEYYLNGNKMAENLTGDMINYYEITGLRKMTTYETYVIVVDKIGNRVKSETVTIKTLSSPPVVKSIHASSLGRTYAKLHVNTSSDRPVVLYTFQYNDTYLEQVENTFTLNVLEEDTEYKTSCIVYDSILNKSDEFIYYFKTVLQELTIKSYELSKLNEQGVTVTVKYVAQAGLERFEWLINGVVTDTSNSSIYTVTGLKPMVKYILNIKLIDKAGNFVISEDIVFKTESLAPVINGVRLTNITNKGATVDVDIDSQNEIETFDVINNNS